MSEPIEQTTPTWEGPEGAVKGWRDPMGGITIRHEDGTSTYLQPGDTATDLGDTLDSCADDQDMTQAQRLENIGVLLCDFLEGLWSDD